MAEPSDTLSGQESTTAGSPDAQTTIKSLAEKAAQKYVRKDYAAASDLYAQATELQVKLHGEMALSSAEFYFLYGRSLYHLAVSTSDVLGAKPGGNADSTGPPKKKVSSGNGPTGTVALKGDQDVKKAVSEEVAERVNVSNGDGDGQAPAAAKPYFQFAGDENWDNSDEDGDTDEKAEDAENDDPDEEENDFTLAWENLDLARLLFDRKVQELQNSKDDGKATEDPDEIRHSKERLADAHDLLAEISLEHETYSAAADDFLKSLSLKQELYPTESSVIAEAHYKLSLALEFASIKNTAEDTKETGKNAQVQYDKAGREEAAKHMEAAIHSAKLRVEKEEALLATETTDEETMRRKKRISRESVEEVKEMIADMEQRLIDLRTPPIAIDAATGSSHPLAGILGSLLGETPAEQKAKLEHLMKGANDLSGLVRRKKAAPTDNKDVPGAAEDVTTSDVNSHKKRKVAPSDEEAHDYAMDGAKKAKTDDLAADDGTSGA